MAKQPSDQSQEPTSFAFPRLKIISFRYWIIFFILGVMLLLIFVWAFLGNIPIVVQGKGIVVSRGGLFSIQAKQTGIVRSINAKMGQNVKKGDLLLDIYLPELELKLKAASIRLSTLEQDFEHLKHQIHEESVREKKANVAKLEAQRFTVHQLEGEIEFLNQELDKRKELHKEGLIGGTLVRSAEQNLVQKRIDLEQTKATIATLLAEAKKEYRADELRNKEQQVIAEREEYNLLKIAKKEGRIYSPYNGKVLAVMANDGDFVQVGTPLIWMENELSHRKQAIIFEAFFPVTKGKRLSDKLPAEITLSTVNPNQYGKIKGHISQISSYAVSRENVMSQLSNSALINYLTNQNAAVLQVMIEPDRNSETHEIEWTSGMTPPLPISTGTVGDVEVTVEKIRPIYYLIPLPGLKNAINWGGE